MPLTPMLGWQGSNHKMTDSTFYSTVDSVAWTPIAPLLGIAKHPKVNGADIVCSFTLR
jgi:hypothetical protein